MTISFFNFPFFTILLTFLPYTISISFNFNFSDPDFDQYDNIKLEGDALWNRTVIYLTNDYLNGNPSNSVGRASYKQPVPLYSETTGEVTNFTTSFTFFIQTIDTSFFNGTPNGDGIAFFIAPFPSQLPKTGVAGGCLGLISLCDNSAAPIVAVEFDTFKNWFDPSGDHVGIDVTNMTSIVYNNTSSMKHANTTLTAIVNYNGATKNLSVSLSFDDNPSNVTSISAIVDMRSVFNDSSQVAIGFSSATGDDVEIHQILRWSFNSSFDSTKTRSHVKLIVGLSGLVFLVMVIGLACWWLRRLNEGRTLNMEELPMIPMGLDLGPRKIPYHELDAATFSFDENRKLGQGGSGSVYKGFLERSNSHVAIKKISKDLNQGEKDFVSEITVISKLAHRNLVELQGWCHKGTSFLLVYEFMLNGSLDNYLYGTERTVSWPVRYKIATDLADAILYLHEKYKKCVIHRDIKPSNIMLDLNLNAKLGDFGLARFVDRGQTMKTTCVSGTPGYIAPEYFQSGKATTLSDVFSYGVTLLEMSCGKTPNFSPEGVSGGLVEWVWDLYGKNSILNAAHSVLNGAFDARQMECVMVVGLWCAHPDFNQRPSIRDAIKVLSGESQLPSLPCKKPQLAFLALQDGSVSSSRATTSSYGSCVSTVS